jgi:hypothetical protein
MKLFFLGCILTLSLLSCTPRSVSTLPPAAPQPPFDLAAFERTCALADALARDDRVAWQSSDSISAEKPHRLDSLDRAWFVDDRDGKRYAFYGRYLKDNDVYRLKYAFMADGRGDLHRIPIEVDGRTLAFARAVSVGTAAFKSIDDSLQLGVEYNHYIRKNSDGSYSMWFFPAGYGTYCAHGLDVAMVIDATGATVISHKIIGQYLRYFELDRKAQTIELDNTYTTMPSLGNIFFTIMNREHFDKIVINNSQSTSTMVRSPDTKEWSWVHVRREE